MSTTPPALSPAYREYSALLRQLHALIRIGQGDSPEADEIRDAMDDPGDRLDEKEAELVGDLSADLYTIGSGSPSASGESIEPSASSNNPSYDPRADSAVIRRKLQDAAKKRRWKEILVLLRQAPMALKPSEAAYVRGRCWAKIGDLDSGLLFLEEAIRLDPNAFHHWIQTLDLLAKLGRSSQVIELISALADRSGPIIRSVGRRPGLIRDNLTELYAKFHQEAAG